MVINLIFIANIFATTVTNDQAQHQSPPNKSSGVGKNLVPFDKLTSSDITRFLGWERGKCGKTTCGDVDLCGGRYIDPTNIVNTPIPQPLLDIPMNITASEPAFFTQYGISEARGNVVMIQPGREITADHVTFLRDSKTGKLREGTLTGHVNFREYGRLIVAEKSHLNFVKDEHTSDNLFYRLLGSTPSGVTNVWGRAKQGVRDKMGVLRMKKATYHTCPPDIPSWHLWSNRLILDRNTGRGEAFNAFLFVREIPVLYTPYFNFPIDKRRKTGFLFPEVTSSKDLGMGLTWPYYLNLAPNYDATITPRIYSKRGILFNNEFNYLTPHNTGKVNIDYFPYDKNFANFRDNVVASYPPSHARTELQNSSSHRGFFSAHNDLRLNDHWKGAMNVNYVTDDYFLQDYNSVMPNQDQLFNEADLSYTNDNWRFSSLVQGFQTLHRIAPNNSASSASIARDQYKKLPQLNLAADFPDSVGGLNYQFASELVNFAHRNNFDNGSPVVGGRRFNVDSSASLPLNWYGIYITPRIQLDATNYAIHDRPASDLNKPNNITRVMPLFSVDSGAVLSRNINLFRSSYMHTLEPRLFYLYVPTNMKQDDIPVFDTNLLPLDFDLRTNRFSGIDRIGDANQITGALTTRLLDDYGGEKLTIGLNQTVVVNKHLHQVFIGGPSSDTLATEYFSPLVGSIQCSLVPKVSANASAVWDHVRERIQTTNVGLSYNDASKRVINVLYNYGFRGDTSTEKPYADLQRVGVSAGWRLWQHWVVLGNVNYNMSYHRPQDYIYGIEYDSCCWAIRFVRSKVLVGQNADRTDRYDSRSYVQFFLKGLGEHRLGNRNLISVSGYQDTHAIGL